MCAMLVYKVMYPIIWIFPQARLCIRPLHVPSLLCNKEIWAAGIAEVYITIQERLPPIYILFPRPFTFRPHYPDSYVNSSPYIYLYIQVCVAKTHQGQGLAKQVVHDALQYISTCPLHLTASIRVSLLHCSPALTPVYAALGYLSVPVEWSLLPFPSPASSSGEDQDKEWKMRFVVAPLPFLLDEASRESSSATRASSALPLDEMAALHEASSAMTKGIGNT